MDTTQYTIERLTIQFDTAESDLKKVFNEQDIVMTKNTLEQGLQNLLERGNKAINQRKCNEIKDVLKGFEGLDETQQNSYPSLLRLYRFSKQSN